MRLLSLLFPLSLLGCAAASDVIATGEPPQRHAEARLARIVPTAPALPDGSPEALVALALREHPSLRAELDSWRAERAMILASEQAPTTTLSYSVNVRHLDQNLDGRRHGVSLTQSLPLSSQRFARSRALAAAERARPARYDLLLLQVRENILVSCWNIWEIEQLTAAAEEQVALLDTVAALLRGKLTVGKVSVADVERAEIELTLARERVQSLQARAHLARITLARRVGLERAEQLPSLTLEAPAEALPPLPEPEQMRAMLRQHPQQRALLALIAATEADIAAAHVQNVPRLSAGVQVGMPAMASMAANAPVPVVGMIALQIPTWRHTIDAAEDAARARGAAREAELREAELALFAELDAALTRLRDASRRLELQRDTLLPLAQSAIQSRIGAYEAEQGDVTALLGATSTLLQIQEQRAIAQADIARELVRLETLLGTPLVQEASP